MNDSIREILKDYTEFLEAEFGGRLLFTGLQGSQARGEAAPASDIDLVCVLDSLDIGDLKKYETIISKIHESEKICGFIAGREQLENWEKSDLFSLCFDTIPFYGDISYLIDGISDTDVIRSVLSGACNLYHAACHNFLHEKNTEILSALYKGLFFVMRAKYFCESGVFVRKKSELISLLPEDERLVLDARRTS